MHAVATARGAKRVLSRGEKRLLDAIAKSDTTATIVEICQKAKVNPKVYYRMIHGPDFTNLVPALNYVVTEQMLPVVKVVIAKALQGSAKHAELLFRVSGLMGADETKILQIFGSDEVKQEFLGEAQLQNYIRALLK